jgi:predicted HAD superfamily Cof-like phosphohydrolase
MSSTIQTPENHESIKKFFNDTELSDLTPKEIVNIMDGLKTLESKYVKLQREYEELKKDTCEDIKNINTNIISNAYKVKQFTEEGRQITCPPRPQLMDLKAVRFIVRMKLSEIMELVQTVLPDSDQFDSHLEYKESITKFMTDCMLSTDFHDDYVKPTDKTELIAEQYDAFVDDMYYTYDTACKHGVNLDTIFDVVHEQGNMAKRFPDGKFHLREEDGKILKPADWKEPDVLGEVKRQIENGGF